MIILQPSPGVKKEFDFVDFEMLSLALTAVNTTIFKKQHNKIVKVHKSKLSDDHYMVTSNTIYLRSGKRSFEDVVSTIVHEFRHWVQDYVLKESFTGKNYDESSFELYKNCKLEKDARKFEELYDYVAEIYRRLVEVKELNAIRKYKRV